MELVEVEVLVLLVLVEDPWPEAVEVVDDVLVVVEEVVGVVVEEVVVEVVVVTGLPTTVSRAFVELLPGAQAKYPNRPVTHGPSRST